jgi:hypothetical protein
MSANQEDREARTKYENIVDPHTLPDDGIEREEKGEKDRKEEGQIYL